MEFVADLMYGAPKDLNYPYRAYIAPKVVSDVSNGIFSYKMKLPSDVVGDLVLIQWWWGTGNTCDYVGYEEYNWPASWGDMNPNLSKCVPPTFSAAEQFWNCAEVKILDNSGGPILATPTLVPVITLFPVVKVTSAPTMVATSSPQNVPVATSSPVQLVVGNFCGTSWSNAKKCGISCYDGNSTVCGSGEYCYAGVSCSVTTKAPTKTTTKAPTVKAPSTATTKAPTIAPQVSAPVIGVCGEGQRGNGVCSQAGFCCSAYGYCGTGSPWCDPYDPIAGTCGGGKVGNGICAQAGYCCSAYGYCGAGAPWCSRRILHGDNYEG